MNNTKFYALSMAAVKIKTSQPRPSNIYTTLGLKAWALISGSIEEAKRKGLDMALKEWPEADDWRGHDVTVAEVSKEALVEALEVMSQEDGDAGEIELIM